MFKSDYERANELIIYAQNEVAQDMSNLVHGGRLLGYPSLYKHSNPGYVMGLEHDFVLQDNINKIQFERINSMRLFALLPHMTFIMYNCY